MSAIATGWTFRTHFATRLDSERAAIDQPGINKSPKTVVTANMIQHKGLNMLIHKLLITVGFTALLGTGNANAAIVDFEDFTHGVSRKVSSDWSINAQNTTSPRFALSSIQGNQVLGGYNIFGAGHWAKKFLLLSGNQTSVDISLDFWKGDSWDGERFIIEADGTRVYSKRYSSLDGGRNLAGGTFPELLVPISLNVTTTGTRLFLRFTSSLNQNPRDEWWAIDNLLITENVPTSVPEPTISLLMLGAFTVLVAGRATRLRTPR